MARARILQRGAAAGVSGLFVVAVMITGVKSTGGTAEERRAEGRCAGGRLEAFEVNDKG